MKSFTSITPTKTATVAAITTALCASMLTVTPAQAASNAPVADIRTAAQSLGLQSADLEQGLELISEIPDSVLLAGDAAVQSWMAGNHPDLIRGTRADIVGCAGAIAWLIASTAIPAAKVLKIKRLINGLGGVAKAVQLFWGASFKWEKIQALGGAAAALGAELLGIAAVQQKCFS
ncbi:hypothetical protein E9228_003222 [Curtobacterium flaccumfaciens]|uniref:Secreted protein n=1 Tax=Curtobacterium salicis TaxID=1779862 RepID=A0ABX0TEE5_9MICO|nr:hypothetical protein [Curtobacterium sp. WW7]NII42553.1 hypothetical protein [Curtobacterium sp. WW7]